MVVAGAGFVHLQHWSNTSELDNSKLSGVQGAGVTGAVTLLDYSIV